MKQYSEKFETEEKKSAGQADSKEKAQGLLDKIYTKMSGHPSCEVELQFIENRQYFKAGDDLCGVVKIKTTVEGQQIEHQGIKVSLIGMVLQLPNYAATNTSQGFMNPEYLNEARSDITAQNISKYRQYTFMQIQKQVEYSGNFSDEKEVEFAFKNLDEELRDHESYDGIDSFVKYFIKV